MGNRTSSLRPVRSQRKIRFIPDPSGQRCCCVLCGTEIVICGGITERFLSRGTEHWKDRKTSWFGKSVTAAAGEVEQTGFDDGADYQSYIRPWSVLVRAIIENPETWQLSMSGIGCSTATDCVVPTNSNKAYIKPAGRRSNPWYTRFRWVDFDLIELQGGWIYRSKRAKKWRTLPQGYILHVDCWLLVDRVIGLSVVKQNLRTFVEATRIFWLENPGTWSRELVHWNSRGCSDGWQVGRFKINEGANCCATCWHNVHTQRSPLRCSGVQEIIDRASRPKHHQSSRGSLSPFAKVDIPVELAIMIVDNVYFSAPTSRQTARDTYNMLRAFKWELPGAYWKSRVNTGLIWELRDIKPDADIDWGALVMMLEERLLTEAWYCSSGLKLRAQLLDNLAVIEGLFLNMLEPKHEGNKWVKGGLTFPG
ncbi:uncharacterized protein BDV17DRAFT_289964 [Aspergillus undulatus]|uniref:uncharacterized protein n=1 Tax=Aspergillus undulatus TaxID=1810928 RepID=UPI003CCD5AB8